MKKVKLQITGMHCTSCAMSIDGDLEDTEGVKKAQTNYAKSTTEVEFDPEQVTVERLCRVIGKTGYKASPNNHGAP